LDDAHVGEGAARHLLHDAALLVFEAAFGMAGDELEKRGKGLSTDKPSVIVEVLSPSTQALDLNTKPPSS
jgi:hypothetical protein